VKTQFYACPICGELQKPNIDFMGVIYIECECGTKAKIIIEG